jgi:hypothetical protein
MFFSKQEWRFAPNQKQLFTSTLNAVKIYIEYLLLKWKFFYLLIKKNYLGQVIPVNEIKNFISKNFIISGLKKIKNSRSTIILFFNIPFILSKLLLDIVESIKKKTIYLYRIVLLLSMPLILFCVNNTFVIQEKKDFLSYIIPENKSLFFNVKNSLFLNNLKKEILCNQLLPFLSKKVKNYDPQSPKECLLSDQIIAPFLDLPNINKKSSLTNSVFRYCCTPFTKNNFLKNKRIQKNQKQVISNRAKWLYIYLNIKKKYSPNFQNDWINLNETSNNLWIKRFKSLKSFKLFQLSKNTFFKLRNIYCESNINFFLRKDIFQRIDSFFFSLIKPRDLHYLNKVKVKILSNKRSFVLDFLESSFSSSGSRLEKVLEEGVVNTFASTPYDKQNKFLPANAPVFLEDYTKYSKQREIKKNVNILQSTNKQHWILPISQWIELYNPQNNLSYISKKKQALKEYSQFFNNFNFVINIYKNFLQNAYVKALLNSTNLPFTFIKSKQQSVFKSYTNSLIFTNSNLPVGAFPRHWCMSRTGFPQQARSAPLAIEVENSLKILINKKNNLAHAPLSLTRTNKKNIVQKINFLYNFSLFCPNAIFFNPETLLLVQNRVKVNNCTLVDDQNIYDFDFYLTNNNPKDDLFWISNLSLKKTLSKQKEKQQNQKDSPKFFDLNKKRVSNFNELSLFTYFQEDFNLIEKKRAVAKNRIILNKSNLLQKYNKWFFTPQWWFFRKNRLGNDIQSFLEELNNRRQILIYGLVTRFNEINKIDSLSTPLNIVPNNFVSQIQWWNKFFVERIHTSTQEKPLWINLKILTSVNNNSWNFFSWFITSSLVYYHWLPMLTGAIYLYLWLDFEKIRSLSYPSWKTVISILAQNSFDSPSQQLRLAGYSSRGTILSIYSVFYTKFLGNVSIFNRCNYITTVDLSRKNKNLVSNSLITIKTLQSKYNFWNLNKENENRTINGFNFFQKWCEKNYRISGLTQKNVLKSYSFNWLTDLFFYNKFVIYNFTSHSNVNAPFNCQSKPNPLLEPSTCTKRWLFIGSVESGKSFAIKNIAASTHYPLIHISIKDIKTVTPDSKYNKLKKQKRWIEQLSERSFFLENILNLAKILAPSMLWISDLHDFYTKDQIQDKNTNRFDASRLMATLLKILTIDLVPDGQNHITFVGSTDHPRLLDPKFISRHRLDLIVNFRNPSINQRQSIFTFLLKNKGFAINASGSPEGRLRSFYELNCNTLGYTFQDITSLVNETLLVKTSENTTLIDSNTIRLALYRKTSIQSFKYTTGRPENLQYKIGKALVQTILVYPKSLLLLSKYHDLWKTKFYFLSNSYLEVSSKKTITTEISMLTQVLNCLAGSAARDAWLLAPVRDLGTLYEKAEGRKDLENITLALTSQLKHDFSLASNILQSLLTEFPMQDINTKNKTRKVLCTRMGQSERILNFKFIKKLTPYLEFFDQFPSYIDWNIKAKRLSFSWLLLFSGIEHSTKNLARIVDKSKVRSNNEASSLILEKEIDLNSPYERRETKRQQQKIQKIESLFNKMLYTLYMQNLGFPWESEYVMDYNPLQFSLFFIEARPLWNPQTVLPAYSILFFDRDLLINQKMLTNLYITYGNKFQNEKLNRKRIKKQFFWSNYTVSKLNLNKKLETKNASGSPEGNFIDYRVQDFYFYQNLINLNAQLDQSQIQLPLYLHQGWITPDPNETFRAFDFLYTKMFVNNNDLIYKESLLFENLLEIYHYLLKFFIKNKNIMNELKELLLKNNILSRQDIEIYMKKHYKS